MKIGNMVKSQKGNPLWNDMYGEIKFKMNNAEWFQINDKIDRVIFNQIWNQIVFRVRRSIIQ